MRDDCNELHGMTDAQTWGGGSGQRSRVELSAQGALVAINMSTTTYGALMTPDQARYLARKLHRLARLTEQRGA